MDELHKIKPNNVREAEPVMPPLERVGAIREKVYNFIYENDGNRGPWFRPDFSAYWDSADQATQRRLVQELKLLFDEANAVERLYVLSAHGHDKSRTEGITETEQQEAYSRFQVALARFRNFMDDVAARAVFREWATVRREIGEIDTLHDV